MVNKWLFEASFMTDEEITRAVDERIAQFKERKQMNDITIEDLVEIVDENGNPTGQFRPREAAPAEATIAENHADHVIDVVSKSCVVR